MHFLQQYLDAFVHLWYPHICLSCGTDQLEKKNVLCNQCIDTLPYTEFDNEPDNPIHKLFWGRVSFQYANTLLFFTKDSIIQLLITELKYHHNKKAAWMLGRWMGFYIEEKMKEASIDALIPIPISPSKMKKRKYNQAQLICEGIQSITGLPILENVLIKPYESASQTHKDRIRRMEAIGQSYILQHEDSIKNKHILLVDDVMTTGATIEAACTALSSAEWKNLSVFTATYTI
jgi:ComF family protein